MNDLISRKAVIDVLAAMQGRCASKAALVQNSKIWQQIKDLPSAEPKKGKWIHITNGLLSCSECGMYALSKNTNRYCRRCGAKMEE